MKLINCYKTSGGLTFLALVVVLAGQLAEAEYVVYESATMGPPGQVEGYLLSTDQYMGTRFYVDRQYEVTQIGGHLAQANVGGNFFGAIVALTGPSAVPLGYPFNASEVVASTVFDPGIFSNDFRAPLSVILTPGYYALVFGTNELGSSNGYGIMPFGGQTSFPTASYFVFWPTTGWIDTADEGARFVMEGFISDELLYCEASGSNYIEYQYIMGVEVGSIANIPTGNEHYGDYRLLSTMMEPGQSYPLTITRGNPYHDYYDRCGAWIDWNQDGDFTDLSEQIPMSLGVDPCTFTGTITPPVGAAMGGTRMRVRIMWMEDPISCGHSPYGEVEDYTIIIPGLYEGGSGTAEDPYLIRTAEQMNTIGDNSYDWNKHFKLVADVNLGDYTGTEYNVIGYHINPSNKVPFSGTFDGNDHTISNLSYSTEDIDYVGLFGYVDGEDAVIKNLGLIGPDIYVPTRQCIGGLVGGLRSGTISGCYVQGGNVTGDYLVGGLSGVCGPDFISDPGGRILSCYTTCDVDGGDSVGGLVGLNSEGVNSTIENCYAMGAVSGWYDVGGLVGTNNAPISKCYSVGGVSGTIKGGLVGFNGSGTVSNSFWDVNTSGLGYSDGGVGKTTEQMQTKSTFTDAGWDFTTPVWKICGDTSYPKLAWQTSLLGDFLCPEGVDFFDFSFFAGHWAEENCAVSNDCYGTDFDLLGSVDIKDLRIFADNWLAGL
ncbi:MAG: hypothetical protein GWN67_03010 [Phycisphaerae bacterium]|nr:hypothetical protein [Phycisphaerae bacterium]NIP50922.1 hypothetical protein [Phycisphaerae bacterium]NIS50111.1 hypothetical protein [Phycisphaerae bacterium]NIU07775.1 hypothetical protein [Phycisphaerae bacterium]NIU55388.1 hypothetical protein [Phycisphaerae bacterium]